MVCDICSQELAQGQGTVVPIREMKAIAQNGFGPLKLGINAAGGFFGFLGAQDIPGAAEGIDEAWRKRVLADRTPWLLCPSCYEQTRPFAPSAGKGTEQTPVSKQWWQFWK